MTGRSCFTNIISALNMVTELIDNEDYAKIYILDFSKFLDIVNHRRLRTKPNFLICLVMVNKLPRDDQLFCRIGS